MRLSKKEFVVKFVEAYFNDWDTNTFAETYKYAPSSVHCLASQLRSQGVRLPYLKAKNKAETIDHNKLNQAIRECKTIAEWKLATAKF